MSGINECLVVSGVAQKPRICSTNFVEDLSRKALNSCSRERSATLAQNNHAAFTCNVTLHKTLIDSQCQAM